MTSKDAMARKPAPSRAELGRAQAAGNGYPQQYYAPNGYAAGYAPQLVPYNPEPLSPDAAAAAAAAAAAMTAEYERVSQCDDASSTRAEEGPREVVSSKDGRSGVNGAVALDGNGVAPDGDGVAPITEIPPGVDPDASPGEPGDESGSTRGDSRTN